MLSYVMKHIFVFYTTRFWPLSSGIIYRLIFLIQRIRETRILKVKNITFFIWSKANSFRTIWNFQFELGIKNKGNLFSCKYDALIFVLKMFALRISTFRVEQRMSDADIVALHPITRSAGWGRDSFSLPASPTCHVALPLIA